MLSDGLEHEKWGDVAGSKAMESFCCDLVKNDASMCILTTTIPKNSRGTIVHCMKRILRHQIMPYKDMRIKIAALVKTKTSHMIPKTPFTL